jgi:hypothetical protein
MELVLTHKIYYSPENPIPVKQIAESLLSLENIINKTPIVIEKLFDGIKIDKTYVFIDKIESGSLTEEIIVKFLFGNQENFDKFISKTRSFTKGGIEKMKDKPILAVIILSLILSGGLYAYSHWGGPKENKTTIEANNNVIINVGAGMVEMSPNEFRAIVESAVGNKADLAKDAVKLVRPAKRSANAFIAFDDDDRLRIEPETVQAIPSYLKDDIEDESIDDYENVEIVIRALDFDSLKKGWAVVIPSLSEKRMKLQLDKSIDPEILYGKRSVIGDVTIIFKKDSGGNDIPTKAFLRRIQPETSTALSQSSVPNHPQ